MKRESVIPVGNRLVGVRSAAHRAEQVTKLSSEGLVALAALAPELAHAQAGGGLLSGLTQIIQDVTRTIALDWVFYLGILALVLAALAAKFGHISWGKFGVVFCAIGIAFYAPKIVSAIRDTAGAAF